MPSIYLLLDPRTAEVRYVGWTGQELRVRLNAHYGEARTGVKTYKGRWLRRLLAANLQPVIWLLETTEDYQVRERYWIAHYRAAGCRLVNGTEGGDGLLGRRHSPETRARISALVKQRPPMSDETKAKLRAANIGLKHGPASEETRRKISVGKSGERHHMAKLTWEKVRALRSEPQGQSLALLAAKYGVSLDTVGSALRGEQWKDPAYVPTARTRGRAGERHGMAKLTWDQVRALRSEPPGQPLAVLAAKYGVGVSPICSILQGKTWKDPQYVPPPPGPHVAGERNGSAKLTWDKVRALRTEPEGQTQRALAERYGVTGPTVWAIRHGKTWKEQSD